MSEPRDLKEKELLARIAMGDRDAFTLIYKEYAVRIYSVAMNYLEQESDADELLQEIFIKVWDKRESLTSVIDFKNWLFITARNTIYDHFRRKNTEEKNLKVFASNQNRSVADASHRAEDRQYTHILDEAINRMPPQRRRVYEYAKKQGLGTTEIAVLMGISKNTVQNHLKAANGFIKDYVQDHLDLLLIAAIFLIN